MTNSENGTGARIEPLGITLLEKVVEALIFAADDPVSPVELAASYAEVTGEDIPDVDDIEDIVDRINVLYERSDRSFRINRWGGGYRFATVEDMGPYVKALYSSDRERRLTRTLMETIAILAYRQPTTRSEIEFVRGVDCDYSLRKLMEYGLVDVMGRAETIGRPLLYGTTDRFLELFGLNSLEDLPNLREVESILDDPAFQKEKAKMLMTSGLKLPQGVGDKDADDVLEHVIEDSFGSDDGADKGAEEGADRQNGLTEPTAEANRAGGRGLRVRRQCKTSGRLAGLSSRGKTSV